MLAEESKRLNYVGGITSIVLNTVLFVIKYIAGVVSGSVALLADAWHTLSDSISSIAVVCGVALSSKKPDKEHPFGHGRWESIVSIFIGVLLAIVVYGFVEESFKRFQTPDNSAIFGTFAIVVTVISILSKEGMAQFSMWIYRKTGNLAMKADAWHHRSDALSSVVVLVGIFLQKKFWWIDPVLAILVSVVLAVVVYKIISESINKLMGCEVPDEMVVDIKAIIEQNTDINLDVHHFHIHDYGAHKELTFHIYLPPEMTVKEAHDIATLLEEKINEKLVVETTIHIEPIEE